MHLAEEAFVRLVVRLLTRWTNGYALVSSMCQSQTGIEKDA